MAKISDRKGARPKAYTRLAPETLAELDERAEREGGTRASVMRRIINEDVARHRLATSKASA